MATPTIRLIADAREDFEGSSVYSLGLAESREPGDESFAVIFSISEPDDDGSGYSVVVEPGQRTAYEAVERCDFDVSSIRLQFDDAAATTLGLPRDAVLRLDVSESEFQLLARGLEVVGVHFTKHYVREHPTTSTTRLNLPMSASRALPRGPESRENRLI